MIEKLPKSMFGGDFSDGQHKVWNKINELVDVINKLQEEIEHLKGLHIKRDPFTGEVIK